MVECHNIKEFLYKEYFKKLDLKILQELLKQYKWEKDNELECNNLVIDCLEEIIDIKSKSKS